MVVHIGTYGLPSPPSPAIGTVGMFDGVHLGHQKVIDAASSWARVQGVRSVVLTFDRHPLSVLSPSAPQLLTPLGHKLKLIERLGVDDVVVLNFTRELASAPPVDFIRDILENKLGLVGLVMGFDNGIGRGKEGTYDALLRRREAFELSLRQVEPYLLDGKPVSTTRIRNALSQGRLDDVARMLCRPFSIYGTVIRGDARGRTLGFPTANVDTNHEMTPPEGVYAGTVTIEGDLHPALANIGRRPTFEPTAEGPTVEIHIDGFTGDLYGRHIEFRFLSKLREERTFESREALVEQIRRDLARLRRIAPAGCAENCPEIS
jgi:riboflavin kinase/FMN adenylyltransferase